MHFNPDAPDPPDGDMIGVGCLACSAAAILIAWILMSAPGWILRHLF